MVALKRKINLFSVAATTISENKDSQEFVIHVPAEYDYRYTSQRYVLISNSRHTRREEIVNLIKQLYAKINGKPLPRYAVPNQNLKDFTTTKSEKKKCKYRIPAEGYRVPDEAAVVPVESPAIENFDEESKGRATTLYQCNVAEKAVNLGDFKIIRKLGKGNFGTVPI